MKTKFSLSYKIAFEKAGIIKENTPVVIGETVEQTKNVFLSKAKQENSKIYFAEQDFDTLNFEQDFDSETALLNMQVVNKKNNELFTISNIKQLCIKLQHGSENTN